MIRARPPQHQNLDLHLHQPFFFQFGRGKRALLFLVPVGPAVLRPRRLKFANRASCTRISGIFSRKACSGLSDARGLPVLPYFPTPSVTAYLFLPQRISGKKFQKIGLGSSAPGLCVIVTGLPVIVLGHAGS
jgi:hypothetical protein